MRMWFSSDLVSLRSSALWAFGVMLSGVFCHSASAQVFNLPESALPGSHAVAKWLSRIPWTAFPEEPLEIQLAPTAVALAEEEKPNSPARFSVKPIRAEAVRAAGARGEAGEFWIGVSTQPLEAALRSHLALPERLGIIVAEVVPDGPAAKAGVQAHDVLLKFQDTPLSQPEDLQQVVKTLAGKAAAIELIRGGKRITVEVTPAKRPGENQQENVNRAIRWLEQMQINEGDNSQFYIRIVGPGVLQGQGGAVMMKGATWSQLPDNVSLTISQQGGEPAKITIKRGEESWETTFDQCAKLPPELLPYLERALLGWQAQRNARGHLEAMDSVTPSEARWVVTPPLRSVPPGIVGEVRTIPTPKTPPLNTGASGASTATATVRSPAESSKAAVSEIAVLREKVEALTRLVEALNKNQELARMAKELETLSHKIEQDRAIREALELLIKKLNSETHSK